MRPGRSLLGKGSPHTAKLGIHEPKTTADQHRLGVGDGPGAIQPARA